MKLLLYSHDWLPVVGGIQTITMLLAEGLAAERVGDKSNVAVTLVTQTPAGNMDDDALPFAVVRLPSKRQLARLVSDSDVIHVAGPAIAPVVLGLLYRKPVVIEHHNYQPCCPNGLLFHWPTGSDCPGYFMQGRHRECLRCNAAEGWWKSLRLWLLTFVRRWLCQRATINIVVSRHSARRLELPRSELVYHGIPTQAPVDGTETSPPCFAFVGRLTHEKGAHVILEAARDLRQRGFRFRVKIIGDGVERQRLEAMTDEFQLRENVIFTGFLQGRSLERELQDVSATIMPSLWEEVAPLGVIEPMMQGKLLIASDIGGLGELADQSALKFPPGDATVLAERMRQIIEDPKVVTRMGRGAREYALRTFRWENMIDQHVAWYRKLL